MGGGIKKKGAKRNGRCGGNSGARKSWEERGGKTRWEVGADSISGPRGNKANSLSKCMTSLKSLAENINKMKVDGLEKDEGVQETLVRGRSDTNHTPNTPPNELEMSKWPAAMVDGPSRKQQQQRRQISQISGIPARSGHISITSEEQCPERNPFKSPK
uniref:HDC19488 n=1 Tax=Drosophila melanogaster TaxID=7227 RepID=Q6II83_DROME|nr:TPA_inf: HDC19488 [Drosophila melanogaster]